MGDRIPDGSGFIAAVNHAIGAFGVVAGSVGIPVRLLQELAKGFRITLAEQVARTLPAEHGPGRIAPGRAMVLLVAGQEVEKQSGLAERPSFAAAAATEDVAEQLFGLLAVQEMFLIRRPLVGVARRNGDGVDSEAPRLVEERSHLRGNHVVETRAIDVDAEAASLGGANRGDGAIVDAGLAHRPVVHLLVAVEMDRPHEERTRLILVELLDRK